jgi:hypothetical protein
MIAVTTGFMIVILLALLAGSCGSEPGPEDILPGNWRAQEGKVHTIFTFRKNGSLQWDQKIEGDYNRIVEKKQSLQGQWEIVETHLKMIPEATVAGTPWRVGEPVLFEILVLDNRKFHLKDPDGNLLKCIRVRNQPADGNDLEEGILRIDMKPLIVNLTHHSEYVKNRYLCLDLSFILETGQSLMEIDGLDSLSIHPRVRELIAFYVSSCQYSDVNTFKKIRAIIADLQVILNPYFQTMLEEIQINRVIVTSDMEKVEWFKNALKEKHPGMEKEQEEKSKAEL